MRIAEIFHSIQGEGELTGVPSVFIRTSGCNLRCAWCDTPYASWDPEGNEMSIEQIIQEVAGYLSVSTSHPRLRTGQPTKKTRQGTPLAINQQMATHLCAETHRRNPVAIL